MSIPRSPGVDLPLVSVVVVNFNYGRFLSEAVASVFAQTYPAVQCIVVDDASTDETPAVLDALAAEHPELVVIRRAQNGGQTPASLDGLAACEGQYVIFLDADDWLLPRCVEAHVFAHLSMRPHVGLTSCDMLQVEGRRVVVATGEEMNRFVRSGRGRRPGLVRPYEATPGWPAPQTRANLAERLHHVPPLRTKWVWSSTSGLCFRRDALRLFADNPALAGLRTGTDLYFALGCAGLSGGVLIDEPLYAYRIHAGNIYTARAQLDRTLNYAPGGHGDSNVKAQLFLVDQFVAQAARFAPNAVLKLNLLALLARLDRSDLDPSLPRFARRSRAAQAIVRHWPVFSDALGGGLARAALVYFAGSLRGPEALGRMLPGG